MSTDRDRDEETYIAFIDDETQGLENLEYTVTARSADEAIDIAQSAFPYGQIRAVHLSKELDELEGLHRRAKKKRLESIEEGKLLKPIADLMRWPGD